MKEKYLSRRWTLTVGFAITSSVALFTGHIDGVAYSTIVGLLVGLYSGISTYEKVKANVSKSS